ncbi:hypothetical protein EU642_22020 [Salmonella enterica]|nr:hypothetical protein [Salmonella enterica]EAO0118531.1 hypothetical protein [Salmonella enterica]EAO3601635.1 hypothetical protein [Salmonella enterica]EAR6391529.1 hypothetical protein [Salmonella enterica]EAV1285293.1 hypothetical protein [Salmonella enterica]
MSTSIERGSQNPVVLTLRDAYGKPLAVKPGDQLKWALITFDGKLIPHSQTPFDLNMQGAEPGKGKLVATVDLVSSQYKDDVEALDRCILVVNTLYGRQMFELDVMDPFQLTRSQLFIKEIDIPRLRNDQLLVAASGAMREIVMSDDYIWQKLRAAESELAHKLRILFSPHQIFSRQPTQDEINDLKGLPWMVETPYDFQPNMYDRDKWGYFLTRQRPIIDVQRLRFNLPSQGDQYFDIPLDWLRLDHKYGHVRILPTTNASLVTSSMLGFTALTWQSIIPNMLHLTYRAGLTNAKEDYPELLDAIQKMAVVKIITDLFLPQSGSISADGLSESMSTDVGKYHDQIDHIINGHDGNGGLMAMFNGIRTIVI